MQQNPYQVCQPKYQQNVEKEKQQERKEKKSLIVAIVATVILGLFIGAVAVGNMVGPSYQFQKAVHSHMVNAYLASTPELMEDQIALAIQGTKDLGLTADMYGKLMPWQQTPDWRMDYCYLHLQAIIDRCHEVIEWRNHQDLSSGQVTDVYNQKMTNLRNFIVEGGYSDYAAKGAFYVNFHSFYYVWWKVVCSVILFFVAFAWVRALATFSGGSEEPVERFWWYLLFGIVTIMLLVATLFAIMRT